VALQGEEGGTVFSGPFKITEAGIGGIVGGKSRSHSPSPYGSSGHGGGGEVYEKGHPRLAWMYMRSNPSEKPQQERKEWRDELGNV